MADCDSAVVPVPWKSLGHVKGTSCLTAPDDNGGASRSQSPRHGGSKVAGCPGYENLFAGEIEEILDGWFDGHG